MLLLHVSVYDHHRGACTDLAKVIFILKHPVKLCRNMLFGDVAACLHCVCCVLCRMHSTQHTLHSMVSLIHILLVYLPICL
jgi:hypothetical protein